LCLFNRLVDIWAAGCILVELLVRTPLFPAKTEEELVQRIAAFQTFFSNTVDFPCTQLQAQSSLSHSQLQALHTFLLTTEPVFRDVIVATLQATLHMLGTNRPTAMQLLQGPYLASLSPLYASDVHPVEQHEAPDLVIFPTKPLNFAMALSQLVWEVDCLGGSTATPVETHESHSSPSRLVGPHYRELLHVDAELIRPRSSTSPASPLLIQRSSSSFATPLSRLSLSVTPRQSHSYTPAVPVVLASDHIAPQSSPVAVRVMSSISPTLSDASSPALLCRSFSNTAPFPPSP
jgi:hypothetical protein